MLKVIFDVTVLWAKRNRKDFAIFFLAVVVAVASLVVIKPLVIKPLVQAMVGTQSKPSAHATGRALTEDELIFCHRVDLPQQTFGNAKIRKATQEEIECRATLQVPQ